MDVLVRSKQDFTTDGQTTAQTLPWAARESCGKMIYWRVEVSRIGLGIAVGCGPLKAELLVNQLFKRDKNRSFMLIISTNTSIP